jgi:hypothetical protein
MDHHVHTMVGCGHVGMHVGMVSFVVS